MSSTTKKISIKMVGSQRAIETIVIAPGTTTADVLAELRLDATGFQLSNSRDPDVIFANDDVLYARVSDGDLLYCSAVVAAGLDEAA